MTVALEGGCFCGKIRYRISGPSALSLLCFCRDCLTFAGTDGYAGLMVANEHFERVAGTTATFRKEAESGRSVVRHFCGACGTNLWGETELGLTSVAAGTLDDPESFTPERVVFTEAAPSWARIPSHLIHTEETSS